MQKSSVWREIIPQSNYEQEYLEFLIFKLQSNFCFLDDNYKLIPYCERPPKGGEGGVRGGFELKKNRFSYFTYREKELRRAIIKQRVDLTIMMNNN